MAGTPESYSIIILQPLDIYAEFFIKYIDNHYDTIQVIKRKRHGQKKIKL